MTLVERINLLAREEEQVADCRPGSSAWVVAAWRRDQTMRRLRRYLEGQKVPERDLEAFQTVLSTVISEEARK